MDRSLRCPTNHNHSDSFQKDCESNSVRPITISLIQFFRQIVDQIVSNQSHISDFRKIVDQVISSKKQSQKSKLCNAKITKKTITSLGQFLERLWIKLCEAKHPLCSSSYPPFVGGWRLMNYKSGEYSVSRMFEVIITAPRSLQSRTDRLRPFYQRLRSSFDPSWLSIDSTFQPSDQKHQSPRSHHQHHPI